MLRTTLFLAATGTALTLVAADLTTDYAAERTVTLDATMTLSMELVDSSFLRDGEPFEGRGGGGGGSSSERRVVLRDRVLKHADARPTSVRRTFETVEGTSTFAFGEEERELPLESPFDGLVVELADVDGEVEVDVLEGDAPDDEHLEALALTLALDALLPPDADAEEGDTWALDADAVRRALLLDLQPHLFPPQARDDEEGGGGRGGGRGRGGFGRRGGGSAMDLLLAAEYEGEAELVALGEEGDEGPLARIRFEAAASGDLEDEAGGGDRGGEGTTSYTVELEGELVFSLATRRPVALEVEGALGRVSDRTFERGDSTMEMHREEAGRLELVVEVTQADVDDDE